MSARRFARSAALIALSLMCFMGVQAGELEQDFNNQLSHAKAGDVQAMYAVGEMYELGMGTVNSRREALNWYRAAADKGHPGGAYQVGYAYYWGKGVNKDRREAHVWFLRAAEGGDQAAIPYLSKMYALGQGVPQDKDKAAAWAARADTATNLHRPPPKPEAQRAIPPERAQVVQQSAPAQPAPAPLKATESGPQPVPSIAKTEIKPAAKPAPRRVTQSRPKPQPRKSTIERNIERLLTSQWQKGTRPALYLPSSESHCQQIETNITCRSATKRSSLIGHPYEFQIVAQIADFDNQGHFNLSYAPEVTQLLDPPPGDYSADSEQQLSDAELRARVQRSPEQLRCQLTKPGQIDCEDERKRSTVFTTGP